MENSRNSHYIIKPTSGFKFIDFKEIWTYRDLAYMMVLRDLKARYSQTALGPIWIIVTPLINTFIFSFLLGTLANLSSDGLPYPVFTYIGFLAWELFSKTVNGTVTSMQKEINLMSKVYYPRLVSVISYVTSNIVDFFVSFIVLFIILALYGITPSINIIFIPFFLFLILFCGVSFGIWFAGPNVKYRDISNGIMLILSALRFLSPVVYSTKEVMSRIPEQFHFIYYLNPFTFFVEGFRWCIVGKEDFAYNSSILISYTILFFLLIGGLIYFKKWERNIVDIQ